MERKYVIIIVYCYKVLEMFTEDTLMVFDYQLIVTDDEHFIELHLQTMLHLDKPVNIFLIFIFLSQRDNKAIHAPFKKVKAVYFKTLIIHDLVAD